jgi:hypothetical protein
MLEGFTFLKDTSWGAVFRVWEEHEGSDPVWQEYAKKEGWESWRAWREHLSSQFGARDRRWKLYEVSDPAQVIPKFLMGPFRGWQNHYEEKNIHTFVELVRDHTDWVADNIGVRTRKTDFPVDTQFIGVYIKDEGRIVLYEGHHRAAAIALAAHEGSSISFTTNPVIAITEMGTEDTKQFRGLLKRLSEYQKSA